MYFAEGRFALMMCTNHTLEIDKNSSWTIKPQHSTALNDVLNTELLISEMLLA